MRSLGKKHETDERKTETDSDVQARGLIHLAVELYINTSLLQSLLFLMLAISRLVHHGVRLVSILDDRAGSSQKTSQPTPSSKSRVNAIPATKYN